MFLLLLLLIIVYYYDDDDAKIIVKKDWSWVVRNYGCWCYDRHALIIQLYLRIDRLDLAQKQLKTMKSLDEDSILSMLATAWVNLSIVSVVIYMGFKYIWVYSITSTHTIIIYYQQLNVYIIVMGFTLWYYYNDNNNNNRVERRSRKPPIYTMSWWISMAPRLCFWMAWQCVRCTRDSGTRRRVLSRKLSPR